MGEAECAGVYRCLFLKSSPWRITWNDGRKLFSFDVNGLQEDIYATREDAELRLNYLVTRFPGATFKLERMLPE